MTFAAIAWDLFPFDFSFPWVYDPEFGWLQFCWFPDGVSVGQPLQ